MEQTWRWFGPQDKVSLADIKQTGATGIVSALHDVPPGTVWPLEAIRARKALIEASGLTWSVVESIPVHEQIKYGGADRDSYIEAYKQSVRNIGSCGLDILCYNFMPVVDATRTDFNYVWGDGSVALRFDRCDLAAFDLHILKRPDARSEYTSEEIRMATERYEAMTAERRGKLSDTIVKGFPGLLSETSDSVDQFQRALDNYKGVSEADVQENLAHFLREVVPVAEESGIYMAIHPDDPPIPLFGLPRVVSTAAHLRHLLASKASEHNGLTMCVGSYGARTDNDIASMVEEFAQQVNFVHLRNVQKDTKDPFPGSFTEADHLTGDVDMFHVMATMLKEKRRRDQVGKGMARMPYRPDHGHHMLDDAKRQTMPGYPAIGRLRGLAELRGLELAILQSGILQAPAEDRSAAAASGEESSRPDKRKRYGV
eukprot:TRINITY_DN33386_c1_g1_i1.p1 TRINITY_DN33386_c1_g1~~TRINITY_DN33386_c1_g1_i1.p1  ORF type:complete len:428 (+),score=77.31 TRINITY_DN33386_c1_g1_i1:279-1562(+)